MVKLARWKTVGLISGIRTIIPLEVEDDPHKDSTTDSALARTIFNTLLSSSYRIGEGSFASSRSIDQKYSGPARIDL